MEVSAEEGPGDLWPLPAGRLVLEHVSLHGRLLLRNHLNVPGTFLDAAGDDVSPHREEERWVITTGWPDGRGTQLRGRTGHRAFTAIFSFLFLPSYRRVLGQAVAHRSRTQGERSLGHFCFLSRSF